MTDLKLSEGTYNVRVLRTRARLVEELMEDIKVDVLEVQEILLLPTAASPTGHNWEAVMRDTSVTGQCHGGTALPIKDNVDYKLAWKGIRKGYEAMMIRIATSIS